MRLRSYQISRLSEEVVIASVNENLLLSHPQSEIWLDAPTARGLVSEYRSGGASPDAVMPEWLTCSVAAGRLLLSDQRSGRWVLLGADHIEEFERRLELLKPVKVPPGPAAPVMSVKGIEVHLQSAFRLARTFREFGRSRQLAAYEEAAPEFRLAVTASAEGILISDTNNRAGIMPREAIKWSDIIEEELKKLNAREFVRGRITTVVADGPGDGRFVLQWGDEVFIKEAVLGSLLTEQSETQAGRLEAEPSSDPLVQERINEFNVVLDRGTSSCVALASAETSQLLSPI